MSNIVVYTMGRTGSTWLIDYIIANFVQNSLPVYSLWEYWGENRVFSVSNNQLVVEEPVDWDWAIENIDQDKLFNNKTQLIESINIDNKIVRHTEHLGYTSQPYDYMITHNFQWITMARQDKFEQMLSMRLAQATNRWHAWSTDDVSSYNKWHKENTHTITIQSANSWFETYLEFVQRRRRLAEAGKIVGNIMYERMLQDSPRLIKDLLSSRGITEPIIIPPADFTDTTKKLSSAVEKQQFIANYDELHNWYNTSKWPSLLK